MERCVANPSEMTRDLTAVWTAAARGAAALPGDQPPGTRASEPARRIAAGSFRGGHLSVASASST